MSLFTGEPRNAHVEADTDMELWALKKEDFDNISAAEPDLLTFLTELVADRFDSRRPIADRTIGKYLATDIIGRGGFSLVYKGEHLGLNMPVAIKMMRHDMAADPDFLGNFRNEAKTIANLNHENIVKVYDIEERYRTVFIVMEFVQGESLTGMLKRLKTIPARLATDYLYQICSGLDYAHLQGIIHRDINTKNIIVQQDDRLKILDFGLACPMGTEDFSSLGTLMYMAPEQINSDPLDQRTDIYALGIMAYEMVVGKRPFPEDDVKVLTRLHQTRNIPDPAEKVPDLPEALRKFILKAGKCDPDQRFQNIVEAQDAIRPLTPGPVSGRKKGVVEARKETTIFMSYGDDRQTEFKQLMEEFSARARKLGGKLKISDNT
jgi:serine/threonine protein kinase